MKKLILGATAILFFSGAVLAQDKTKEASCCKKSGTAAACCKKDQVAKSSACCKQPSKTAALRTAAAKPAKPVQPATASAVKPSGK
ncbi:hypothetical protein [Chitinophaga sp. CF418]|uniref:hypothetical protein n=1 Tax=Chitinophaga sp. CF418 TaxID=1855287 RepID=UPI000914E80A|nr:hypothetical protein [Chitinophaga sp. CF418]SHM49889.1 hypothetical protein SAMN05216311_102332 [Chitinophaga sp. CF418]